MSVWLHMSPNLTFLKSYKFYSKVDFLGKTLAKPKSQILIAQLESINIFPGLISRWMILAEWKKFRAQRILYIMVMTCSSSNSKFLWFFNIEDKSLSPSFITRKMWSSLFGSNYSCSWSITPSGIIISMRVVVKILCVSSVNFRRINTSLWHYLRWTGFYLENYISFIATFWPVLICMASTTVPKEPFPSKLPTL
jgi:hypothetical protein